MKNKLFCDFLFANVGILMGLVACSETSTAGGTVDDNAVAGISADEQAIMESGLDSIKFFTGVEPESIDDYKIDSTDFWYEVAFSDVGEDYFSVEEYDSLFACNVRIYRHDFGVQVLKSEVDVGEFTRSFFMTVSEDGVVYHTKLDNDYYDVKNCEKDIWDFEYLCENEGGTLYRHKTDCEEKILHLTCTASVGHLSDSVADILGTYAQKMKNLCMEGR